MGKIRTWNPGDSRVLPPADEDGNDPNGIVLEAILED